MIPLIDCVFLLLVFFMFAMLSMSVHRGLRVRLPSATGEAERTAEVMITVSDANEIAVAGRALPMDEAVLEAVERARETGAPVLINGDRAADLGVAIELMGRLRRAGIEAVSFLVEPDAGR